MARVELVEASREAVSPATASASAERRAGHADGLGRTDAATARATAIIPARGGSVGLPGKNLARIGGVPLIVRAVGAALAAERIDHVIVSTDDAEIANAARAAGATIVDRPAELSGPTATSESALLHALDALDQGALDVAGGAAEITVFVQATSPFIDPADLDAAVQRVADGECDVVFAAAPTHVFIWRESDAGAIGVNHDAAHRPRRQDRELEFVETGAFYVFRTAGFRDAGHRFFGRVGIQRVPADHVIEIDDAADLARARMLASANAANDPHDAHGSQQPPGSQEPRIDVDALVTDFDGVHTDDTVMVDQLGRESVRVSRSDGAGIARLRRAGIPVLILSAEENPVVGRRAEKLGVECAQGVAEKGSVLREWAEARGIPLDRIAYLGNDRGDLPALELVGWPVAVPDAAPEALAASRHVLRRLGGHGAVRELADLILAARDPAATFANPDPARPRDPE